MVVGKSILVGNTWYNVHDKINVLVNVEIKFLFGLFVITTKKPITMYLAESKDNGEFRYIEPKNVFVIE